MAEVILLGLAFAAGLAAGVPIAFAIGIAACAAMLWSIPLVPAVTTVAQRTATSLDSFTLLAIPLFILAGELMNHGGSARRLIDLARWLLGSLPGGLVFVHVFASMLFGSVSGSAVATASAIGGVMGPRMQEEGYDRSFATALNVASATTGLIIPPSNILIVYSLASGGVSIAALFLAGYLPGLLVGLVLMLTAGFGARRAGATRGASRERSLRPLLRAAPSLGLPIVVIGGILAGVFTPTEAAGVAVLYALALGRAHRELDWQALPGILTSSATTTGVVGLLIGASSAFAWVLAYARAPQAAAELLLAISDDPTVVLLLINLALLAAGTVLDMTPAVLVFTPIFLPVVTALGYDPVHFGIVMILNLCIGLCTPPVGSVLFVGCSTSGARLESVVKPLLPLFAAMLLALAAVTLLPELSLALPRALGY